MITATTGHRLIVSLAAVAAVGLVLVIIVWSQRATDAMAIVPGAVLLTSLIAITCEVVDRRVVARSGGPMARLFAAMAVRSLGAASAIAAATLLAGAEPVVVALVAAPLYLSLLAGEVVALAAPARSVATA